MGMFDTIRISLAGMPEDCRTHEFQTKDLAADPNMDHYELRADGCLYRYGKRSHDTLTGDVEFYTYILGSRQLITLRTTFVSGVCTALRVAVNPDDDEFPGWDSFPNLMS